MRLTVALVAVSISTTIVATTPTVVRAQGGTCVDGLPTNLFSGEIRDVTAWANGVHGTITTPGSTYFYACSLNTVGNDGTTGWVSLEPGSGNPTPQSSMILQIGVVRCTSYLYTACEGNIIHYFWAYGGCWGSLPGPRDLGSATHGAHTYEISQSGSDYKLYIGGVQKASIPKGTPFIGCWTNQDLRAGWFAERLDHGDSSGSNGSTSQRLQFTNMSYRVDTGSTWITPSLTGCINDVPSGTGRYVCTWGASTNWFHVWTIY
jgi:hypothetical protein